MRIKYAKPLHKFRLSRLPDKRYHMVRIMVSQLMQHERIYTTAARAKHIRSTVEALITMGRKNSIKARSSFKGDFDKFLTTPGARKNFFSNIVPRFKERRGACTRVVNLDENRKGDNAPTAYIELIGK